MSRPPVTLIGNPVSPYVRKILAICAVKGIEVAIDPITPFRGDERFSKMSRAWLCSGGPVARRRAGHARADVADPGFSL